MSVLNEEAVGCKDGDDANKIVNVYVNTPNFSKVLDHTHEAALARAPAAAASAPGGPSGGGMMGGGSAGGSRASSKPLDMTAIVPEHEVFKNERDALAFFFYHQASLDNNPKEGPFWFRIQDNKNIVAGTEAHYAVFEGVTPDLLDTARQRGVIMLVEFENQQPLRCTPCYLSDSF